MRWCGVAAALCAVAGSYGTALAAPAKSPSKAPPQPSPSVNELPMQVSVVRSAAPGCEPNCSEWIAAQGQIDSSTPRKFKKVFAQIGKRRLPVLIHSIGGSVDESLAIGRMIRAKGLEIAVTKTELLPCATTDKACQKSVSKGALRGRPVAYRAICASACAFILAAGTRRFVGAQTLVGVHQLTSFETRIKVLRTYRVETRKSWFGPPETRKTLVSEKRIAEKTVETPTADSTYKRVKTYFTEMGITPAVMPLVMSATHKSIHWLSRPELRDTKMATDFTDGERLITGAAPPSLAGPKGVTGFYNLPVDDGSAASPAAEPADRPATSPANENPSPINDETPGIAATYDPATYDPATMLGPCDGSERAKRGCFGH